MPRMTNPDMGCPLPASAVSFCSTLSPFLWMGHTLLALHQRRSL